MTYVKALPATRPCPNACESCGHPPRGTTDGLVLDHDHTTGAFRGWLCRNCNIGLGMLGDTREAVMALLAYLDGCPNPLAVCRAPTVREPVGVSDAQVEQSSPPGLFRSKNTPFRPRYRIRPPRSGEVISRLPCINTPLIYPY